MRRRILAEAAKLRSKNMYPALALELNGLRDKELANCAGGRWISSIRSNSPWGSRRRRRHGPRDPAERYGLAALQTHAARYIRRFGEYKPE
jgi:hypothetical protein